jgi:hypothetical protein
MSSGHHRMKLDKSGNQFYDKHQEHMDQTPLGKIQQQYWTTKQQVMKKLGKKQDEFIVLSDAELDAKLDVTTFLIYGKFFFKYTFFVFV